MESSPRKPPPARPCSRVRIIGRVRPMSDLAGGSDGGFPISVENYEDGDGDGRRGASVFVHGHKSREPYKIDHCYKQDDDLEQIFEHEVKHLINLALEGCSSAIVAYGAPNTGKSFTIRGSDERPGLASLAVAEFFSNGGEGSRMSLTVSSYEVYQDRVYDLLSAKEQEVLIFEDNGGRISFKGLSQVQVTSIGDFNNLYLSSQSQKVNQKEPPRKLADNIRRSHKGVIIYVSQEGSIITSRGKLNFVDLAGYEDPKQFSNESLNHADSAKANNKSLYTLQSVIHAVNAIESRIPFRESKLTRILQDYMGRTSLTLLITCLNPKATQDMIQTLGFSSRSCLAGNQLKSESSRKVVKKLPAIFCSPVAYKCKTPLPSSLKKSPAIFCSLVAYKCKTPLPSSLKKTTISKSITTERKVKHVSFQEKERNLFNSEHILDIKSDLVLAQISSENDELSGETIESIAEIHSGMRFDNENMATLPNDELDIPVSNLPSLDFEIEDGHSEIDLAMSKLTCFDTPKGCQNETPTPTVLSQNSPPASAKLRELTNTLKSMSFSTPTRAYAKESLVNSYLRYLNSASKEDLKKLRGIGEKRADNILKLREMSPEPFKTFDDIKDIGLSAKQVKKMMNLKEI